MLKGRSNYVCLQRLRETPADEPGGARARRAGADDAGRGARLGEWAATTRHRRPGRARLGAVDRAWQSVSVSSRSAPARPRCPLGEPVLRRGGARAAANAADVVVVNTHLYGLDVASGGMILPEHDVVVIDEAHQLEDIMSDTVGFAIGAGRFARPRPHHRASRSPTTASPPRLERPPARRSPAHLEPRLGPRLRSDPIAVADADRRPAAGSTTPSPRCGRSTTDVDDAKQRMLRAQQAAGRLVEHIDRRSPTASSTSRSSPGRPASPPRDRAHRRRAGAARPASGTSARRSSRAPPSRSPCPTRVGLPADGSTSSTSSSPFDYEAHALLYCAAHLPDPRRPGLRPASHDELEALIAAAGGRTLALFTSWRAMDAAAEALKPRLPYRPHPERPARSPRCSRRSPRGVVLPVRHRRPLPGRRHARPPRSASSPSTGSRSPAPTTRC